MPYKKGVTCTIDGCDKPRHARGLCSMHGYRADTYGDPLAIGPRGTRGSIVAPLEVRFWRKVNKAGPIPAHRPDLGSCWEWAGAETRKGYVSIAVGCGKTQLAHRLSYEWERGPIREGWVLDHLCLNKSCVRPSHLDPVTQAENARRARSGRFKKVCKRGHDQAKHRVQRKDNAAGYCGACASIRQRERRKAA